MSVTSLDVALRAGVSQPTVSRIMRNQPGASAITRAKVLAVAAELGYVPSDAGRALATKATNRIALLTGRPASSQSAALVDPIRELLSQRGLIAVELTARAGEPLPIQELRTGGFDGVIVLNAGLNSDLADTLAIHSIPAVFADEIVYDDQAVCCRHDNATGAAAVADLVVGLGHQRIVAFQGLSVTSTGQERAEALIQHLRPLGLPAGWPKVLRMPSTHQDGYAAARKLLADRDQATAIICGSDEIAYGVLSAAAELGVQVPEELTVIGFGDLPMSRWPVLNLTTVACDFEAMAQSAVDLLSLQLRGGQVNPGVVTVPVALVERGSHAPPPAPAPWHRN